jgi:hypothetical protein
MNSSNPEPSVTDAAQLAMNALTPAGKAARLRKTTLRCDVNHHVFLGDYCERCGEFKLEIDSVLAPAEKLLSDEFEEWWNGNFWNMTHSRWSHIAQVAWNAGKAAAKLAAVPEVASLDDKVVRPMSEFDKNYQYAAVPEVKPSVLSPEESQAIASSIYSEWWAYKTARGIGSKNQLVDWLTEKLIEARANSVKPVSPEAESGQLSIDAVLDLTKKFKAALAAKDEELTRVREHSEQYRHNWLSLQKALGCDCHLDALEKIASLNALREEQKWISVIEELPPVGDDILFNVESCYGVEKGRYTGKKWVSDRTSYYNHKNQTLLALGAEQAEQILKLTAIARTYRRDHLLCVGEGRCDNCKQWDRLEGK